MTAFPHLAAAWCVLTLLVFTLPQTEGLAATPTVAQVLAELRLRHDSLANWEIEATWEDYQNGKPIGWEVQTVWRDNLSRTRYRYHYGDGPLPPEDKLSKQGRFIDDLYNGEVTVNLVIDPSRGRLGNSLAASDRKADSENLYRVVTIYDGRFPRQGGIESHREPMNALVSTVIEQLSELSAAGTPVTVEPVSGQQDVYELGYQRDPKDDEDRMTHQVVVDAGKGWIITRHEEFFPNGKSARRRTCEYQRTTNGMWLPAKGQFRHLWGGDVPDLDWRFTVRRAVANNPQFDQSIFDVRVPPRFYVTDMRQNVSCWVGEQVVSNADLTRLTQQALDARSARTKGVVIPQDTHVDPANKPGTLTQIGRVAPEFSLTTLEEHPFRMADQRGHVVLLNFFATWCGPCQEELPHLQNIWNEFHKNESFNMLVIGREETSEKVAAFRTKHGFTFPLAADPDRSAYGQFATERIPRTYLISREGTILYQCTGYYETELAKLKALIKAELKKEPRRVAH